MWEPLGPRVSDNVDSQSVARHFTSSSFVPQVEEEVKKKKVGRKVEQTHFARRQQLQKQPKEKEVSYISFFLFPVRTAAPRGRPCAFADGVDALTTWRWKDIRAAATVADVCDVTHNQTESIESKKRRQFFCSCLFFSVRPSAEKIRGGQK